jgi:hypothetical protein
MGLMHLDPKNKKIYLIGGAVGVGVVGWIYLHNKSSAANSAGASSDSSSIDPATGYPYGSAQDTAALAAQSTDSSDVDPATGFPYGSAGDEAALSGSQDTGAGASSGYNPVSTTPVAAQTNAAWAQAATATLVAVGYSAETVAGALGAYLGGIGLTPAQVTIVQAALAEDGPPPVGTFSIIAATSAPAAPAAPVGTTTIKTAPTGFRVTGVSGANVSLAWNAVTGATGYTVAYGATSGSQEYRQIVSGTSVTVQGVGGTTQKNKQHYFEVWANPAAPGGPHAGPIEATTT